MPSVNQTFPYFSLNHSPFRPGICPGYKSRHYILVEGTGSGAEGEDRGLVFWEAHALGQDDAEAVEERGLGGVGLGDATQADLAVRCGRQDDVVGLDAGKLFEDGRAASFRGPRAAATSRGSSRARRRGSRRGCGPGRGPRADARSAARSADLSGCEKRLRPG